MKKKSNYSAGLCIYCTDCKKLNQGYKNPIAASDFKWIFACNCEGTEQLQRKFYSNKFLGYVQLSL